MPKRYESGLIFCPIVMFYMLFLLNNLLRKPGFSCFLNISVPVAFVVFCFIFFTFSFFSFFTGGVIANLNEYGCSDSFKTTVTWLVLFKSGVARPIARGKDLLKTGPGLTNISDTK